MAKIRPSLEASDVAFIERQSMFFVATAPSDEGGRINLSPKALDTFRCIDEQRVAYLDLTGSGNETAAHLNENGRITVMFCAFSGSPSILRIYGRGEVVRPDDPGFASLAARFDEFQAVRQIMVIAVDSVQKSCGFGIPKMKLVEDRDELVRWAAAKGEEGVAKYQERNNQRTIDGKPVYGPPDPKGSD